MAEVLARPGTRTLAAIIIIGIDESWVLGDKVRDNIVGQRINVNSAKSLCKIMNMHSFCLHGDISMQRNTFYVAAACTRIKGFIVRRLQQKGRFVATFVCFRRPIDKELTVSISDKASYSKISYSLEAVRYVLRVIRLLRHFTDVLSNSKP